MIRRRMVRYGRFAIELAGVLMKEARDYAVKRLVSLVFTPPDPPEDLVIPLDQAGVEETRRVRESMISRRSSPKSKPPEDNPPLEPSVGSLKWREEQKRAAR